MTTWHGWRGPHSDMVILDESHVMPLATVDAGSTGIKDVVFDGTGVDWTGLVWPRLCGKRALVTEFTLEGPVSETARLYFVPWAAELLVRRDRTVHRLAYQLRLDVPTARRQFDLVQHVLEAAGIGDGYGQLTIPQPTRPAAPPWPASNS